MTTLGERVKAEREARNWSQAELARQVTRAGFRITQAGISNIENRGETSPQCAPELAGALGVAVSWLRTGKGAKTGTGANGGDGIVTNARWAPEAPSAPGRLDMARDVPVLGTTVGGNGKSDLGEFEMNGQIVDYVRRPVRLAGRTDVFGFYVSGESVAPWREPGDLIYVEAAREARAMDYVVVELKPPQGIDDVRPALVKRLLATTPTKLRLRQYNPARDFDLERAKVLRVYRVLDWNELMGV